MATETYTSLAPAQLVPNRPNLVFVTGGWDSPVGDPPKIIWTARLTARLSTEVYDVVDQLERPGRKCSKRSMVFLMIICLSISMAATRTVPDDDLALVRGRLFIRCCLGVAGISEPE